MIFIGTSLGGFQAVQTLLTALPPSFRIPVVIVMHRQKDSDGTLLELLQRASHLPTCEPLDKEPILPGRVYLAPADYHLLVEPNHFCLSVDEPVRYSRPSIDVLFESAADAFGPEAVGVVLTGANGDGARGAARIKSKGGQVIVQDPSTAVAPQMPQGTIASIDPDYILSIDRIAPLLIELTSHDG